MSPANAYQGISTNQFTAGMPRSMSFMICKKDSIDPFPGFRHDLVIAPSSFQCDDISRDSLTPTYGGFDHQKHASRICDVKISGSCGKMIRVINGETVSGESILNSLRDLFRSVCGFYPSIVTPGKYTLYGSNTTMEEVDPSDIELRWFNWGLNIESNMTNINYYTIVPTPGAFSISWQRGKIIPTYSISFMAFPRDDAPNIQDAIMAFFSESIYPNVIEKLKEEGFISWADQYATRIANMSASYMNSVADLRWAMEQQRSQGGQIPFDYGQAKGLWDKIKTYGEHVF
jgi:hypothetical protein